jgi:hypothetical protein
LIDVKKALFAVVLVLLLPFLSLEDATILLLNGLLLAISFWRVPRKFAAYLDRDVAKIISFNLQKISLVIEFRFL